MKQSRRDFIETSVAVALCACEAPSLRADNDPAFLSLSAASDRIQKKSISPVELTQACLRNIERLNPKLNAFITVTAEAALAQARELEAEVQRGRWRGPLHGIPIALKDNIDTAGIRTTAASELFKDRVPSEDAEVVRRLRTAGAIVLGKTNLHEFAYGGTSTISYFGPAHNRGDPCLRWGQRRTTGGKGGSLSPNPTPTITRM